MKQMQLYLSRFWSETGFSLLSTLSACSCLAILCTMLVTVAQLTTSATLLRTLHDQSYWLARSAAIQTIKDMQNGIFPQAAFTQPVTDEVLSGTASVNAKNQWVVHITASFVQLPIKDTVVFVYDFENRVVIDWQNNAAP